MTHRFRIHQMCNSGNFLSCGDGLGTSYARSFLASAHARFHKELDREMSNKQQIFKKGVSFPEIYKKMLPCLFQGTNEVMFLSWSLIKRQKTFFCNTFMLKFEQMYLPKNASGYGVIVRHRNHRRRTPSCTLCILNLWL